MAYTSLVSFLSLVLAYITSDGELISLGAECTDNDEGSYTCNGDGPGFGVYIVYEKRGNKNFSHFGPSANLLDELQNLFNSYASTGTGKFRRYLHNSDEAAFYKQTEGTFTSWEEIKDNTDLLFYEGLLYDIVGFLLFPKQGLY